MGRSPSLSTLKVLRAFLDDPTEPVYGLQLVERSGVKPGGLYPTLDSLEEQGVIVGRWEDIDERVAGRRRRRYYRLTAPGEQAARQMLAETVAQLAPPEPPPKPAPALWPTPTTQGAT